MTNSYKFADAPGHLIRRAQQIAVAVFMEETLAFDVTPIQFAILNALIDAPGEDQVTLSKHVAFDPATFGSVVARLEVKGWVKRAADHSDKRRKLLWVTKEGKKTALKMKKAVDKAQIRIVSPLTEPEQQLLVQLVKKLVAGHGELPANTSAKTPTNASPSVPAPDVRKSIS